MKRVTLLTAGVCLGMFAAVVRLDAAATLTTLHIFTGTDGDAPVAGLALGTNGDLYGTTEFGGTATNTDCIGGCGTVFEISLDGAFTSLHSFTNSDGNAPRAGLLQASDGNLYGTTAFGGSFGGLGTVFRITPGGVLTNLHTFRGTEGNDVEGTLIEGPNGILYGTTSEGGTHSPGTVFQITTNGAFASLNANPSPGLDQPAAGVVLASDGNLYGTSEFGGTSTNCNQGCGAVYRVTPDGVVTTLHSFDKSDGQQPKCVLVEGSNGILYGTTSGSEFGSLNCSNGCGTVFQITTNGEFATLHAFAGPEGKLPQAGLVFGSDGNLYGTASGGGTLTFGTVFQVTTNGTVTRLVSFIGSNGGKPDAPLILGPDGAFYGTTEVGGGPTGAGLGTVFKLTVGSSTNQSTVIVCTLNPLLATNTVGTSHTVTATVTSNSVPRAGVSVNFSVTTGPNAGQSASSNTVANGQAVFTYTSNGAPGTDTIRAISLGATGTATKVWIAAAPDQADLALTKTDSPDPVDVGSNLTYTVTVTNNGPTNATDVLLTDTLPASASFVSASANCTNVGGTVTCGLADLGNGSSAFIQIVVIPNTAGSITNTATVAANEADPVSANNTARAVTIVNVGGQSGGNLTATLSAVKQKCKTKNGATTCALSGLLTVVNHGATDVPPVHVRFFLSADTNFNSGLDLPLGEATSKSIKAGKTGKLKLKGTAPASGSGQFILAVDDSNRVVASLQVP